MTGCHLAYVQTEIRSFVMQFEIQIHLCATTCSHVGMCTLVDLLVLTALFNPVLGAVPGKLLPVSSLMFRHHVS